jgi:ferrous iron transport protein B
VTESAVLARTEPARPRVQTGDRPLVVVVGNPNVGKTTLFNQLTGQNARVGNYPGITVERRVGMLRLASDASDARPIRAAAELCDVPGAYSLSARSAEEQIAINAVLGLGGNPRPELAVVVVDAGQLVRNLYLVLELIELEVPLVIALNMIDEVADNPPDPEAVSKLFGVPCVATNARKGAGVGELKRAIARALADPPRGRARLAYPAALRRDVDRVADALPRSWRSNVERDRALALWALSSLEADDELVGIDPALRERCEDARRDGGERDLDQEAIATRYAFLDEHAPELFLRAEAHPPKHKLSEKLDRVLLHPVFGFLIFIGVMLVIFQALFSWSDPAISLIEAGFTGLQKLALEHLPAGVLRDLLSQGLISGVGNVVVFLPQILLLFLFIGILEDSGYMARVAYLMDRIMRSLGLHGRAFIPMLSGFACAVPAILATRTMERRRDRLLTMMVIPLMTCSARLPVYTLIIAALFPPMAIFGWVPVQGLLLVGMYLFSVFTTLVAAAVLGRTAIRAKHVPLILELPPYRVPSARATLRMMWERSGVFMKEAGTIILACTVVLWALLSFPKLPSHAGSEPHTAVAALAHTAPDAVTAPRATTPAAPAAHAKREAAREARALEFSYGGRLGKWIEPALKPLGFDWKIGVGIIGAFAAREVFISTMGLVYGIGKVDPDQAAPLRQEIRAQTRADGKPVYTPLVGFSLMIFFALACQCMSTLAVVRRETKSLRWPAFMFAYMTTLAWIASFFVYQGGRLLGF